MHGSWRGNPARKNPQTGRAFFTTKEKGTGLGLMMCHQIMEAHQGSMKIESQVGKGTRVELCLPVLPTSM
ncbi:ATP-binding protein [Paenibacillus larvae]|nr:ATP-binding protein [Paenibacillus larvae]MDT2247921.1 ATP-binding protein [Paenibacillus larvae]MDT2255089.1 ATP-binding protein [Paenibacillus larvae]MDT2260732.1 ATP-binding protein [Paenibacillus larvae]MDT2293340.1 ATP-binding protein [Paenibacillus larvae]